jgi:hypothetical protein
VIQEKMAKYLRDFSKHIKSDNASTDEFLVEGMSFGDCLKMMDHVSKAVEEYVVRNTR